MCELKILRVLETHQIELKYLEHYLTDEFKKQGIETDFLTSTKTPEILEQFLKTTSFESGIYADNNSKVIRLKSVSFYNKQIIVDFRQLLNLVRNSGYDIIHMHGIGNFITFSVLFSTFFMKKKPIIVINDHSNPSLKSLGMPAKIFYAINRFLFNVTKEQIDQLITVNQASSDFLRSHYKINQGKIEIIPLGYDADIFKYISEKRNNDKEILTLGFAGKINEAKNIELLIDVVLELDNVKCKIVGLNEGTLSEYQNKLLKFENDKINFQPLIKDRQKLAEFYNEIDVAVFPGSISITTIEATGCGTPVILYRSMNGLEDRVTNSRGVLFGSKEELHVAIQSFIVKKKNAIIDHEKIAKNTMQYSWKIIAEKYLEVYQELLDKK